jgi:hypothetical protein
MLKEKQEGVELEMKHLEKIWNKKFVNTIRRQMSTMIWPCGKKWIE